MPKQIIIKTMSSTISQRLEKEFYKNSSIHFSNHKINGFYTTSVKCQGYYESLLSTDSHSIWKLHYHYLYTTISQILCNIIIDYFEHTLITYAVQNYHNTFSKNQLQKLNLIVSLVLDSNYPSFQSKKIDSYRKNLIFHELIVLFRKNNYINLDAFSLFQLQQYYAFLKDVIAITVEVIIENNYDEDLINFILNNLLK